jgi:hypothetical protein
MDSLNKMERSRLKLTIAFSTLLFLLTFFPMWIITMASLDSMYEVVAAWSAWAACVGAIATLVGYYVNKETTRPSFVNNTTVDLNKLIGEDHSDPEEMPL